MVNAFLTTAEGGFTLGIDLETIRQIFRSGK